MESTIKLREPGAFDFFTVCFDGDGRLMIGTSNPFTLSQPRINTEIQYLLQSSLLQNLLWW